MFNSTGLSVLCDFSLSNKRAQFFLDTEGAQFHEGLYKVVHACMLGLAQTSKSISNEANLKLNQSYVVVSQKVLEGILNQILIQSRINVLW